MNPRITTIIVGSIILILGLAGLVYPDRVMGLLGYSVLNTSHAAAVLGEVRATYGGLFVVMGVYTVWAAMDPSAHRARITFVGFMWLGAGAGRLVGASIDGNPGLPGWFTALFELIMGAALVAAAWMARPASSSAVPPAAPLG
jgi:drug/metabolite transporter superfamily protein YnfA